MSRSNSGKGLPVRPFVDHISGVTVLERMTVAPRIARLIFKPVIDGVAVSIQPKIVIVILAHQVRSGGVQSELVRKLGNLRPH